MRKLNRTTTEVRAEIVTTTFVASGMPEGIHDLGRFLEMLNNPALARQIELAAPSVRPLYNATAQLELEAPLLVRRDDIIFANFEGPHFTRGTVKPAMKAVPVLLMAPPFQISGIVEVALDADGLLALRGATLGFFVVRQASVFDADGHGLGEGDQIVVNATAVQMMSATRQRIEAPVPVTMPRRQVAPVRDTTARDGAMPDDGEQRAPRAA